MDCQGPCFLSLSPTLFKIKLRKNQSDQERNKLAVFQAVMFSKVFLIYYSLFSLN